MRQHFDTLSDQAEGEKACLVSFLTFFNCTVISLSPSLPLSPSFLELLTNFCGAALVSSASDDLEK